MTRAAKVLIGLFVLVEIIAILAQYQSAFFDEGIYLTSGLRSLQGYGYSDGYLVWFSGSLLWPTVAAVGYTSAGLVGARLLALAFATISAVCAIRAAAMLFEKEQRYAAEVTTWTALALFTFAPFLALAKLAVLDLAAMLGVSIAFLATVSLIKYNNRIWLVLVAAGVCFGGLGKYPLFLIAGILVLLLYVKRRSQVVVDLTILTFVFASILVVVLLPVRYELSGWWTWATANRPTFGANRHMILYAQILFDAVPVTLGLVGMGMLRGQRKVAAVLLLAGIMWPTYHVLSGNPVSDWKHSAIGFVLMSPLIGVTLMKTWESRVKFLILPIGIAALSVCGYLLWQFERSWPDIRPSAEYLIKNVKPGEKLLIDDSWTYTFYLYGGDVISSPWVVSDQYAIDHGQALDGLCNYDWFVLEKGGPYQWSFPIVDAISRNCGFTPVFTSGSSMVGLASDYEYHQANVTTIIFRKQ